MEMMACLGLSRMLDTARQAFEGWCDDSANANLRASEAPEVIRRGAADVAGYMSSAMLCGRGSTLGIVVADCKDARRSFIEQLVADARSCCVWEQYEVFLYTKCSREASLDAAEHDAAMEEPPPFAAHYATEYWLRGAHVLDTHCQSL